MKLNSISKVQAGILAPAAGAGLGKAMFDELLSDPGFPAALAKAAREGLEAMTPRRWDKESQDWVSDPDYRVRTQTLFALLAQAEGEPVKRVQVQTQEVTREGGELEAQLATSPAARLAMRRILDAADTAARGKAPRKVEPVGAVLDVD
jgi:hypothetical protein